MIPQARAQSVGRILIGFYQLPDSTAQPIDFVVNPEGNELRSKLRWVFVTAFPPVLLRMHHATASLRIHRQV